MALQQAVIFDLDGTLLDTLTDLATSGNEILARRGHATHSTEAYRTFIGDGMANLVQRIFPKEARPADGEQTEQVLAEFRASYEDHWNDTTSIFPGVAELLNCLSEEGFPLGVLSNKAHDFTIKCVDEFLGEWQWDAVYGARDGVPRKPDPAAALEAAGKVNVAPENCFFIGDSDVDMFTAKNAGMHAVGVAWGFRSVEELHSAGAEAVLAQPG
ncbi:MAG: HAD family hydrolase, partial [Verrucomicrobiales bacterium]|nr:HAD family hydrolase [Verrucomicrobiales bacterium]